MTQRNHCSTAGHRTSPCSRYPAAWTVGLWIAVALAWLARTATHAQDAPIPDDNPGMQETDTAATIERILEALERQGGNIRDIRCKVEYTEEDRINVSTRRKSGEILFQFTDANPNFLIHFDKTSTDGVKGKREWYLFDGQWLSIALERQQQVTRRRIADEGERIDLFDIDKTPFPLPFGHRKEEILRHFDVSLGPDKPEYNRAIDHLICEAKPESRVAREYQRLELFVSRGLNLPLTVVIVRKGGYETVTARFPNLDKTCFNKGARPQDFAEPRDWRGWQVVVEE